MLHGKRVGTLAGRLTLRILIALLLVFAFMITGVTAMVKNDLVNRELKTLTLLSQKNANLASDLMATMLNKQNVLMDAIRTMKDTDPMVCSTVLPKLLENVGSAQDDILSLYFVAEPNLFLPDTPNGYSIFTSESGVQVRKDRFSNVDQASYQSAVEGKTLVIMDPFQKQIDGIEYEVMAILQPVLDENGTVFGVVGCNIDTQVLRKIAYDNGGYESFSSKIICGHQTVILDSEHPDNTGKPFASVSDSSDTDRILQSATSSTPLTFLDAQKDGPCDYSAYVPFKIGNSSTSWLSGTSISQREFNQAIQNQVILMVSISILALAALVLFTYWITKRMHRPLHTLEDAIHQLSKGNLQVTVDCHTNDELGRVSASFNDACQTLYSYVRDIDRAMGDMAQGNFVIYPEKPFIGDFSGIEHSITNFIYKMCMALDQIRESAGHVSASSNQVAGAATVLSQGSTEQAHAVDELADTIAQLADAARENYKSATLAGTRVTEAGERLAESDAHMQNMMDAITEITHNSSEIGKIIKTIEDIAFQTNILALNAAVEAARAGTAGKGFSVVASEVRNLAAKSAEAAKSTTDMIKNTIQSVEQGSRIAAAAAKSLVAVQEKAASVNDIVVEISTASKTQIEQVEIIHASSNQISQVVQTNSATSEETAASAEELSSQAEIMNQLVSQFKLHTVLMNQFSDLRN